MRSRTFSKRLLLGLIVLVCASPGIHAADDLSHHYAENEDVRIHYAAAGTGPLLVFIHGFPDYWYTWHHQMKVLKNQYRVVAIDTRGYNLSGSPSDQSDYDLDLLIEDVKAVIKAEKAERAYIIGHDWGGAITNIYFRSHSTAPGSGSMPAIHLLPCPMPDTGLTGTRPIPSPGFFLTG